MIDKICLITGANSGIGKEVALGLAESGAHVILVCRNAQKGSDALEDIKRLSGSDKLDLFIADLSSQNETRHLSEQIHKKYKELHVLINNAGVSLSKKMLSVDGIEMTLATNHLGPFLLSHLLLDLLKAGSPSRIINISSTAHKWARIDLDDVQFQQRPYQFMQAYAQSKLFLMLVSHEFARRLEGSNVSVNSMHPGAIGTKLLSDIALNIFPESMHKLIEKPFEIILPLFMTSAKQAAKPIMYLAMSPDVADISGHYFVKCKRKKPSSLLDNEKLVKTIWELSEKWVGING